MEIKNIGPWYENCQIQICSWIWPRTSIAAAAKLHPRWPPGAMTSRADHRAVTKKMWRTSPAQGFEHSSSVLQMLVNTLGSHVNSWYRPDQEFSYRWVVSLVHLVVRVIKLILKGWIIWFVKLWINCVNKQPGHVITTAGQHHDLSLRFLAHRTNEVLPTTRNSHTSSICREHIVGSYNSHIQMEYNSNKSTYRQVIWNRMPRYEYIFSFL